MKNNTTINLRAVAAHHGRISWAIATHRCPTPVSSTRSGFATRRIHHQLLSTRSGLATHRIRHTMKPKEEGNAAMGVEKSSTNPLP